MVEKFNKHTLQMENKNDFIAETRIKIWG